eukprot:scaffold93431_cov21-Prasinocladus_malaysianus.AAC.1
MSVKQMKFPPEAEVIKSDGDEEAAHVAGEDAIMNGLGNPKIDLSSMIQQHRRHAFFPQRIR